MSNGIRPEGETDAKFWILDSEQMMTAIFLCAEN